MIHIADVIEYEGGNNTIVWKHPLVDFNSSTQLIVHESQEAVFFMNGQALDLFEAGRYTLETENIPILSRILNRVTGDKSPFHCEVYFINKVEQMAIKWGTDSRIQYMEPRYNFPVSIGACGEMSLSINDSRKLLLKLVGTESSLSRERLVDYFRAFLMARVKPYIAQTMRTKGISIFEIDEHIDYFAGEIRKMLVPDFSEYGVSLVKFFITGVLKPSGDPQYEKYKELHFRQYADIAEAKLQQNVSVIQAQTEAQKMIIESQALAAKRAQEGYTYAAERSFDVMGDIARNEGSGSDLRNAAMGIGMGFGTGGAFGAAINEIANKTMSGLQEPPVQNDKDMLEFKKKLEKLTMMKEAGILSDDEYADMKKTLLSMI